MADLTLELGVPSGDRTLPASAGNVRRVVLPAGTKRVVVTSEAAFFLEEDPAQAKADDAASDTAKRHKYVAGTYEIFPVGSGRGASGLTTTRYLYLVGSANNQPYWVTAYAERGT